MVTILFGGMVSVAATRSGLVPRGDMDNDADIAIRDFCTERAYGQDRANESDYLKTSLSNLFLLGSSHVFALASKGKGAFFNAPLPHAPLRMLWDSASCIWK